MEQKEVVDVLAETGALLRGHFELRSGLHSNQFFQCAHMLRHPAVAERLCVALVDKLKREQPGLTADGVISPALGGIVVGHEVARALGVQSIFAEKEDGMLVLRRFSIEPGMRLVVAEDVITRGGRVQETIDIVEREGGEVAAVAVLIDRSAGKAQFGHPTCSLLAMAPVTWSPDECPLCEEGVELVHPGS